MGNAWKYHMEDLRGPDGAILEEIGLRFLCVGRETNVCLLGQLDVRRPDDVEKAVPGGKAGDKAAANDDSSSEDEPERKRLRQEQYGLDAVIAE
ncbi:hypothetical protein HPB52_015186 [Rhipicephalus sanguineus]|uniref:Uncharacterized protein n=1 Tax=Rhipicephalus sanguineus TaxID=34632 RepID=A0A9D4SXI2_RHISA|nr:hypothetical protein HPB52_015186 [Rhipicephalus sanguineus]